MNLEKNIFFIKNEKKLYAAPFLFYLFLLVIANYATTEHSVAFECFLSGDNFFEKIKTIVKNKSLIYPDKSGAFIAILLFYVFSPLLIMLGFFCSALNFSNAAKNIINYRSVYFIFLNFLICLFISVSMIFTVVFLLGQGGYRCSGGEQSSMGFMFGINGIGLFSSGSLIFFTYFFSKSLFK